MWLLSSRNVFIASVPAYIQPNSAYCHQNIPEAATCSAKRCCRPVLSKVFGVLMRSRWTLNSERIKGNWEPNLVNEIGHSSAGSSPPHPIHSPWTAGPIALCGLKRFRDKETYCQSKVLAIFNILIMLDVFNISSLLVEVTPKWSSLVIQCMMRANTGYVTFTNYCLYRRKVCRFRTLDFQKESWLIVNKHV